jgi:hypothetical protein
MMITAETISSFVYALRVQFTRITTVLDEEDNADDSNRGPAEVDRRHRLGQLLFDLHRLSHKAGLLRDHCPDMPLDPGDLTELILAIQSGDRIRLDSSLSTIRTALVQLTDWQVRFGHTDPSASHPD